MNIRKTRLAFLCLMLAICMALTSCGYLEGFISVNDVNGSSAGSSVSTPDSGEATQPDNSTPDGGEATQPDSSTPLATSSSYVGNEPQTPSVTDADSEPAETPVSVPTSAPDSEPATPDVGETESRPDSEPEVTDTVASSNGDVQSTPEGETPTEPESKTEAPDETEKIPTATECEHDYKVFETNPNTCTVDGYTVYKCSICDDIKSDDFVPAPGHSYGEWQTVTTPQIGVKGLDKKICGICKHEITRETSVGQPIEHRPGNGAYGYYTFSQYEYGEEMQSLYRSLLAACESFVNSKENVAIDKDGEYVIDYIDIRNYKMSMEQMASVWKIFVQECPAYYWLGNTIQIQNGKLYLIIDEMYAQYSHRQECDAAIAKMTADASALISVSDSSLEKAIKLHDFLSDRITYAYIEGTSIPETARWAHNLEGAAMRGLGVCETYSKTYMYLCMVNGVECLFVSGDAGGPHAWNYVKLEDGWYAVDVTWDDGSGKYLKYSNFGLSYKSISEKHTHDTPNEFGLKYLFPLPTLAEKDLMPVLLYKEEMLIDTFTCPETAFAAMTDAEGDYTLVMLLNDTVVYADKLPSVDSVTFVGLNEMLSETSFYGSSTLTFAVSVTFYCDVTFENVNVTGGIDLDKYTLTTEGLYCSLSGSINGDAESGGIKVNTTYLTEIYAKVTVKIEVIQGYCDEKKQEA